MRKRLVCLAVVGLFVLTGGTGCSSKKKGTGDGLDGSGTGIEEKGVDQEGSLERYRRGGALAGDGGPLRDVPFGFDSYDVDDGARGTLQENADWLRDNPREKVEVEGHCDERGTVEYNLALGAKRARSVKEYLVVLGIPADRITTISYGEELGLCSDHTEECWARNRRAHFVVIGD